MSDSWNLPWEGGCLCGSIRFLVSAPPLLTLACHCTWCQKRSASAFSSVISLPGSGFEITRGEPEAGWSPSEHRHFFCPRCRNWLFLSVSGMGIINLRATMLDEHRWFAPYIEIFAANKLPWVSTGARHSFAGMPDAQAFESSMQSFACDGPRPTPAVLTQAAGDKKEGP
jgi:hypothetical protein